MAGRLDSKVAVVTGGASGIGEGMVRRFVREGAKVFLADNDEASGSRVATECGAQFVPLDVSREEDWRALESVVSADASQLDILVNNAGIVSNLDITQVTVEAWQRLMGINLTGMMLGCQMAVKMMRENPAAAAGSIINTASSTSYLAIPDVAYTTSKAGVVGLTKSVAVHCANLGTNIRCNSIHPGATLTTILKAAIEQAPEIRDACEKMSPLNRMGTVEEVAAMAVFLASDEASFCTGGQYAVEGGTVSQHPKM
ncbi:MAG: SDR family oxidoreductase [Luminiphilus sp.]|nr:SDR family oxidoreductase [Luminiphilus sp.]